MNVRYSRDVSGGDPRLALSDGASLKYVYDDLRDPWARDSAGRVLMHHGFGKSHEWWTPCARRLALKYPVVRYDVRGCGDSAAPDDGADWSVERLIEDARELADHVGFERVDWVGFESGGIVGMAFAAAHPDRVRSLTIVNTPPGTWMTSGRMHDSTSAGHPSSQDAVDALGMEAFADLVYRLAMDTTIASPAQQAWAKASMARTSPEAAKGLLWTFEHTDISDLPSQVEVPTLILAGANHREGCEAPGQEALRSRIPGARALVLVPGGAGGIHLHYPDYVSDTIGCFLADVDDDRS